MSDDLKRQNDRARQQLGILGSAGALGAGSAPAPPVLPGLDLSIGDRVFDRVSGIEGEVVNASKPSAGGEPAIHIRLMSGVVVPRFRVDLTKRATLPTVPK